MPCTRVRQFDARDTDRYGEIQASGGSPSRRPLLEPHGFSRVAHPWSRSCLRKLPPPAAGFLRRLAAQVTAPRPATPAPRRIEGDLQR